MRKDVPGWGGVGGCCCGDGRLFATPCRRPADSPLRGSDNSAIEFEPRFMTTASGGGAEGIRTPDLINAIDALSQLSYSPTVKGWAWRRNLKFKVVATPLSF